MGITRGVWKVRWFHPDAVGQEDRGASGRWRLDGTFGGSSEAQVTEKFPASGTTQSQKRTPEGPVPASYLY
jgi:hypothetical protein